MRDVLHTVHGVFQAKEGHIVIDPAKSSIAGEIIVDAASGDSGSGLRDKRMTRDILEARRYPDIRFAPKAVTGPVSRSGMSHIDVHGSFLIHGQEHEMTIPMQVQMSGQEITATGKFLVPYVAWGMKSPSTFLLKVNDKVEIGFTAVGHVGRPH